MPVLLPLAMRTGKIRIIEGKEWIELFSETPRDIMYTMRVLLRARATRAEPTRYNNMRDLKKYARQDQSPILAKLDVWHAMEKHLVVREERVQRVRLLKHQQRLAERRQRFAPEPRAATAGGSVHRDRQQPGKTSACPLALAHPAGHEAT